MSSFWRSLLRGFGLQPGSLGPKPGGQRLGKSRQSGVAAVVCMADQIESPLEADGLRQNAPHALGCGKRKVMCDAYPAALLDHPHLNGDGI